ncbi:MAG TPA: URC4/urg3 family protein [Xanthobacteraceae bacterium]
MLRPPPEIAQLRSAAAVRERCGMVARWVAGGHSPYFTLDESRLDAVAEYVAEVTREAYPDLNIPYHSRWRHFCAGGIDRWRELAASVRAHPLERARMAVDLVTVSVLLDAGAGDAWRYREAKTGNVFARSEGLAVASLDVFRTGGFSSDRDRPDRVDDAALARIDAATLARHFQADAQNPLIGAEPRSALLQRLGKAIAERPDLFGSRPARPGNLIDHFINTARTESISAVSLLALLLDALAPIWPSALMLDGIPIGDAGRHSAVRTPDRTNGIVPFHKLSQWLTYSLIEPLAWAGITVQGINELTALAEYRNGGLLVDLGAIRLQPAIDALVPHDVQSGLVVEWRALTVALMDRLLERVRAMLALGPGFTLPQMLQGGTWSAGRKIARALRPPDGPPPIVVRADGTVF